MQFSTDMCDALCLYIHAVCVCVCASWEGCGRLTCPNESKLCRNNRSPYSLTLSGNLILYVRLLRRWSCKLICTPISHHTHVSWWYCTSSSSRKGDSVRLHQRCGWRQRDDLSSATAFDKRLIITLSWWRCHWGLRRTAGAQYSQQRGTIKSETHVGFALNPSAQTEHSLCFLV